MELKNITGVFLGDSITEGWGAERYEDTYFNRLAKQTGMRALGYGVGGTRIARGGDERDGRRDFLYRCERMERNADLVVVLGGSNDFGFRSPIEGEGEFAFSGACRLLFEKIKRLYPNAKLVVMLPLHRIDCIVSRENTEGEAQLPLSRYVETLQKIAEEYSLPIVNLYDEVDILKTEEGRMIYCPDGLHPNAAGHALIAERLLQVLRKL
ncbi:MAG: SGNH/GDSL hydrolase family protein [Clostridiales bacterium]|nr:SGNH/GDSL hydrolase family protein [Clostridiales bacterium]